MPGTHLQRKPLGLVVGHVDTPCTKLRRRQAQLRNEVGLAAAGRNGPSAGTSGSGSPRRGENSPRSHRPKATFAARVPSSRLRAQWGLSGRKTFVKRLSLPQVLPSPQHIAKHSSCRCRLHDPNVIGESYKPRVMELAGTCQYLYTRTLYLHSETGQGAHQNCLCSKGRSWAMSIRM